MARGEVAFIISEVRPVSGYAKQGISKQLFGNRAIRSFGMVTPGLGEAIKQFFLLGIIISLFLQES